MDYLPGDEFGDCEPDDVHGAVEVGDDAPHLRVVVITTHVGKTWGPPCQSPA